jgi:hypothetical protein
MAKEQCKLHQTLHDFFCRITIWLLMRCPSGVRWTRGFRGSISSRHAQMWKANKERTISKWQRKNFIILWSWPLFVVQCELREIFTKSDGSRPDTNNRPDFCCAFNGDANTTTEQWKLPQTSLKKNKGKKDWQGFNYSEIRAMIYFVM